MIRTQGGDISAQHRVKDRLAYAAKLEDERERSIRGLRVGQCQTMLQGLRIARETAAEKRGNRSGSLELEEFEC